LLVISLGKSWMLHGALPRTLDTGFQLIFIAASVLGAWTSREWLHKALVIFSATLVAAYIAMLFAHLR